MQVNTAKIIAISKPLISGVEDAQDLISYAARVSNPSNQMNMETSSKLLRYCVKHQHWSIFEIAHATIEITTTRDIARQILRHRSFSFQEFSQRYADPTKDLGFVTREARLQDKKNRQNSIDVDNSRLHEEWSNKQRYLMAIAEETYKWAIDNGIAKEQARAVLPEGNTISRMYMAGSIRSWIHYCQLRMEEGTQKEHRIVAAYCWDELTPHILDIVQALQSE
jgi:thymidylate synthase (FAD)